MRSTVAVLAAFTTAAGLLATPQAAADPQPCEYPSCTPGIAPGVELGAPCSDTTYYVFGVTSWGRLVFCGSPRRYEPRYFRSPSMFGVKDLNGDCSAYQVGVAQAPDGMFLTCVARDGGARWERGDL